MSVEMLKTVLLHLHSGHPLTKSGYILTCFDILSSWADGDYNSRTCWTYKHWCHQHWVPACHSRPRPTQCFNNVSHVNVMRNTLFWSHSNTTCQ